MTSDEACGAETLGLNEKRARCTRPADHSGDHASFRRGVPRERMTVGMAWGEDEAHGQPILKFVYASWFPDLLT